MTARTRVLTLGIIGSAIGVWLDRFVTSLESTIDALIWLIDKFRDIRDTIRTFLNPVSRLRTQVNNAGDAVSYWARSIQPLIIAMKEIAFSIPLVEPVFNFFHRLLIRVAEFFDRLAVNRVVKWLMGDQALQPDRPSATGVSATGSLLNFRAPDTFAAYNTPNTVATRSIPNIVAPSSVPNAVAAYNAPMPISTPTAMGPSGLSIPQVMPVPAGRSASEGSETVVASVDRVRSVLETAVVMLQRTLETGRNREAFLRMARFEV